MDTLESTLERSFGLFFADEPHGTCSICGRKAETRPQGLGVQICADCEEAQRQEAEKIAREAKIQQEYVEQFDLVCG